MKITSIKTAATRGHGMHLWVKIETDAGITGIGECVHGGTQAIAIIRNLAPKLEGRDPFAIDAIFEEMRRGHVFDGGTGGALITALTGIEIALWDLKGKALEVPIYELMGGKFRDKVWVYADCEIDPGMDFNQIQKVVDEVLDRGFTALKVDIDIGAYSTNRGNQTFTVVKDRFNFHAAQIEHERMIELVDMVTRAAGKGVSVAVDIHTRLDVPSAIRVAEDLAPYHLLWIEEPVPPENVDAMREVKRHSKNPICAGENLYLRHGLRDLIEKQAVDIIMPDLPKCGGLSDGRKSANLAELYYMGFAPHNVSSPIGTLASAHVCASVANFVVLEYHWLHRDYWTTIIQEKTDIIKNGYIEMSDRPGIGVELDEEVARQYQFPGTTWFETDQMFMAPCMRGFTLQTTTLSAGDVELLATGFQFTEGPVWHLDGYLLFSDIPANRIYRATPDGNVEVYREPSGHSNGLTLDQSGRLLACEHGNRRVSIAEIGQPESTLIDAFDGGRLNSPNDIIAHSGGAIYFTDPPYGIQPEQQEQPCNGVYRIGRNGEMTLEADDFERPNGLAFSPDESVLYIDDSSRQHVRAFDVADDGSLHNGRIFADLAHPAEGVPDGMKVDREGNVYVTNSLGIWTYDAQGNFLGLLATPETPANCAWGVDGSTLFITARTSVYQVRMKIPGKTVV